MAREKRDFPMPPGQKKFLIFLCTLAALAVIACLVQLTHCTVHYGKAHSLLAQGDRDGAIEEYARLRFFLNSRGQLARLRYEKAEDYYNDGDYTHAMNYYVQVGHYKDAQEKIAVIEMDGLRKAQVGDEVCFGAYEQDNDLTNGKENLPWLVLDRQGDELLLITRDVIDNKRFHHENVEITWAVSDIRTWLNGDFIAQTFSPEEEALILTSHLTTPDNPLLYGKDCPDTDDRIFYLSIDEAYQYFENDDAREAWATEYCKITGQCSISDINGKTMWSLRSPGERNNYAAEVSAFGDVFVAGIRFTEKAYVGVRPAVRIRVPE